MRKLKNVNALALTLILLKSWAILNLWKSKMLHTQQRLKVS